jgi:hypothetical protein
MENEYKVKLVNAKNIAERVVFHVMPDISENRSVTYKTLDPIHMPGNILAYSNTNSRTYNLGSVKLISRNTTEATENLKTLWLLRAWTMPRFGFEGSAAVDARKDDNLNNQNKPEKIRRRDINDDREKIKHDEYVAATPGVLGEPPAVLLLSGYSNDNIQNKMQHINNVPVVITNLGIPYPTDVDYIPTIDNIPMPTIMSLDINLTETHAPIEYERFSLNDFKIGLLRHF